MSTVLASAALAGLPALTGMIGLVLAASAGRWSGRGGHGEHGGRAASLVAVSTAAGGFVLVPLVPADATAAGRFLAVDLPGAGLELGMDPLARATSLVVAAVLLAVVVCSVSGALDDSVSDPATGTSRPRLLGLLLVFAAGMHTTVLATSLPALIVGWEVMGVASGLLVATAWRDPRRTKGGATAFLTTRAADLALFLAAGAALAGGDLTLEGLATLDTPYGGIVAAGLVVAAVGKSAQLPLSGWLSRAMLGPSAVSALLHSATMVAAGGYLLLRVEPLLAAHPAVAAAVVVVGLVTGVVLGVVAVVQSDLKQLLAASTCAQVSVVVVAAGVGAVAGGVTHLMAHAAVKAALFLVAGLWLTSTGTRRLDELRGIARRFPVVGALATLAALTLAGRPPLPLWVTKDLVLAAVTGDAQEPVPAVAVGLLVVTVLSGAYGGRLVAVIWSGPTSTVRASPRAPSAVGSLVVATLVVASLATLALVVPSLESAWVRWVAGDGPAPEPVWMAVSAAAVTLGVVLGVALGVAGAQRQPARMTERAASGWFGLVGLLDVVAAAATSVAQAAARLDDAGHDRLVAQVAPTARSLATLLARVDDGTHRGVVAASGPAVRALGVRVATADTRGLHGVVLGVGRAVRSLGAQARRPQTGLLHQYYFQLAAGAALLLALLLLVPS